MNINLFPPVMLGNLLNNAYFSPLHRILYVATPKVACTSIKWWFADLVDIRNSIERSFGSRESDPELIIHDLFARVAPEFTGANIAGLEDAIDSSDYFKFCVVRNPYTRVFSAWQSKWLVRESLQSGKFNNKAFDFDVIESFDDIISMFELFLRQVANVTSSGYFDVHVAQQSSLLEPKLINYSVVARIEDYSLLNKSLASHIGPTFHSPFSGKHSNVSLLPYSSAWISNAAANLIREIYARDFELFGYDKSVPRGNEELSKDAISVALRSISLLRNRNIRIGELNAELSTFQKDINRASECEVKVYLSEIVNGIPQAYSESRGFAITYPISDKRQTLHLSLPLDLKPLARIRLDPANRPVVIWLHRLTLEQADGSELWTWNGDENAFVDIAGLILRSCADGLQILCLNDDPHFDLAVPVDVLASLRINSCLVVELTPLSITKVISEVLIQNERLIANLRAEFSKREPLKNHPTLPAFPDTPMPHLANDIEMISSMLKNTLDRRDQTIARQAMQLKQMREQLLRAEAQLDLLKDVMLGGPDDQL